MMTYLYYSLLLCGTLLSSLNDLYGQGSLMSTIVWRSSVNQNVLTGELTEISASITTSTNDHITIVQGNETQTLVINKVIGSWTNVNHSGSIQYQVSRGDWRGLVTIEKQDDVITIETTLTLEDQLEQYRYTITNVQIL